MLLLLKRLAFVSIASKSLLSDESNRLAFRSMISIRYNIVATAAPLLLCAGDPSSGGLNQADVRCLFLCMTSSVAVELKLLEISRSG